jgi:Xaa-Pro aminopeptidase
VEHTLDHIFSSDFTGDEFKRRREAIADAIGPGAAALLQGAPRRQTAHPEFSQSKIFFYVSGIALERCYLLIDGAGAKSTLFVPSSDISGVPGGTLDPQAIAAIRSRAVIDEVLTLDALDRTLETVRTLYVLHRPDECTFTTRAGIINSGKLRAEDPFERYRRRDEMLVHHLKERFPKIELNDLTPIIEKMRLIKSSGEIAVLRRTGEMSAQACVECMKATRPGMPVRGLEAIADYVFRLKGGCGHAYEFIVTPSHEESDTLLDGDLVLVDCGPDHHHYTMDIARMWPVNGHFDAWQRHTYNLIAEYHKALLCLAGPGRLVQDLYDEAAKFMLSQYGDDEAGTAIIRNMLARGVRYFNHHVGLSVHDAVSAWRDEPLAEGMVIAVDPMVWLEGVPHRYVRVEDTILITADGCERLTASAPFEVDAVEALMKDPSRFPLDI